MDAACTPGMTLAGTLRRMQFELCRGDLRRHLPNGDKNSITLSEYHDFMGVGIFFLTIIVLKKKPPSHRNSAKIGIRMVI